MQTQAALVPLFSVQTVAVDVEKFMPFLRSEFKRQQKDIVGVAGNTEFQTTLKTYGLTATNNIDLPKNAQADELIVFIEDFAMSYAAVCGYDTRTYKARLKNFWLNEMKSKSVHEKHSHYGSHFSGVIYVDVPANAPGITFESPTTRFDKSSLKISTYTHNNSNVWELPAGEGKMYVWESWLQHQVVSKEFEGIRRSIAFDVVFEEV